MTSHYSLEASEMDIALKLRSMGDDVERQRLEKLHEWKEVKRHINNGVVLCFGLGFLLVGHALWRNCT